MIMTVNGEISPEKLGKCSAHEHLLIDTRKCDIVITGNEPSYFYDKMATDNRHRVFSDPYAIMDNALVDEKDVLLNELLDFKSAGGDTIIDCTLDDIGRDPLVLKELSIKSGVNIIMGCGHYTINTHPGYVETSSIEELAKEMIDDIKIGVKGTGIKAGIIGEIGTSEIIYPNELKVLTASGLAQLETGKAIHVHTDLYAEKGVEVIEILTKLGVNPEKICIDHVDVNLREDYLTRLLDLGAYIEFDNLGKEFYLPNGKRFAYDLERILMLKKLIDKGYKDKILLSNDICLKSMLIKYGGNGYANLFRFIKMMALDNGISEKVYTDMLSTNVLNFIK